MLRYTFLHIPGIGEKTEHYLWEKGITEWDSLSAIDNIQLEKKYRLALQEYIPQSKKAYAERDISFFKTYMPSKELWRVFPDFRDTVAYLDIETTGLEAQIDYVTTITLYNGKDVYSYVRGKNLKSFVDDIQKYKIIITYNGASFDLPFLNKEFGVNFDQIHIDLRYLLKRIGYSGGLKKCEKDIGIDRHQLKDVDGYGAVIMWSYYVRTRRKKYLETLLAYNCEDTINLEKLMIFTYNSLIGLYSFLPIEEIVLPCKDYQNPYKANKRVIRKVQKKLHCE
jgi:uncharacterized protein YprB with RNaseH-like and TPR domain